MDTADEAVAIGHLYPGQIVRIESGVVRHDPVEEYHIGLKRIDFTGGERLRAFRDTARRGVVTSSAATGISARAGCSVESISGGVEIVFAFLGFEQAADWANGFPESVDGADGSGAQMGLEFCEPFRLG
jgi:hypothetical protein